MKRKIISTLALSAVLLTACTAGEQSINTAETTAETSSTEVTEAEAAEDENSSNLKMHFFDFKSINPEAGDYSIMYSHVLADSILFVPSDYAADNTVSYFYDIKENTVVDKIEPAKAWELTDTVDDSKEIIFQSRLNEWVGDASEYAVYTVYADRSFGLAADTRENNWIKHYDRKISSAHWEWHNDLADAETGEVLINGYDPGGTDEYSEEYGWDTSTPRYQFPIDENRFVYQTSGVQALACIGVYDLGSGEAREIPNSADFKPLGVRDGKIYLADGLWDHSSDKVTVLTADPDTLETEVCMEWSKGGDNLEFIMSEDGKYIAVSYSESQRIYVFDTDTKEIFNSVIDEEYETYNPISFADNDTILIPNWAGKVLLIDIGE